MERLPVSNINNKDNSLNNGRYFLDCSLLQEEFSLLVNENQEVDLLLLNLRDGNSVHFEIGKGSSLHLACVGKESIKQFKISANVGQNSVFDGYFADFIQGSCKGEVVVNLNGDGAICNWHLASLAMGKDKKEFDVSSFHNAINTVSHLDNYGVVRENGKLQFSGICKIINGSHGSKAHQNAKIMVFDKLSDGIAKPILKIDDNDIEASHFAVVGKINDEHIFYLTSRGLNEDEAKRIITLGYLKPILNGFSDEEMKKEIESIIEGNM